MVPSSCRCRVPGVITSQSVSILITLRLAVAVDWSAMLAGPGASLSLWRAMTTYNSMHPHILQSLALGSFLFGTVRSPGCLPASPLFTRDTSQFVRWAGGRTSLWRCPAAGLPACLPRRWFRSCGFHPIVAFGCRGWLVGWCVFVCVWDMLVALPSWHAGPFLVSAADILRVWYFCMYSELPFGFVTSSTSWE
jgi:hypothetical protein